MSSPQDALTLQQHEVLRWVVRTLLPLDRQVESLITPHVWRDRTYMGEIDGRPLAWIGSKVNLFWTDFRYRALYIDVVRNSLPFEERLRLFGPAFTQATLDLPVFVVIFTTDFPKHTVAETEKAGFVPRIMPSGIAHACQIIPVNDFVEGEPRIWAAVGLQLLFLQRAISRHRRILREYEAKLQNVLYQTGFLHGYIVRHGLHLYTLAPPRRAGEFGHDFHAEVVNPRYGKSALP